MDPSRLHHIHGKIPLTTYAILLRPRNLQRSSGADWSLAAWVRTSRSTAARWTAAGGPCTRSAPTPRQPSGGTANTPPSPVGRPWSTATTRALTCCWPNRLAWLQQALTGKNWMHRFLLGRCAHVIWKKPNLTPFKKLLRLLNIYKLLLMKKWLVNSVVHMCDVEGLLRSS